MMVTWLREIRDHKWPAVRAILLGWVLLFALFIVIARLAMLDDWLFARGIADIRAWWPDPTRPFYHFLIGGGVHVAAAWMVGRLHRDYWTSMVLVFCASLLVISDLPEFITGAGDALRSGDRRFWEIIMLDFVFMRLPIVVVALTGAWHVRRKK